MSTIPTVTIRPSAAAEAYARTARATASPDTQGASSDQSFGATVQKTLEQAVQTGHAAEDQAGGSNGRIERVAYEIGEIIGRKPIGARHIGFMSIAPRYRSTTGATWRRRCNPCRPTRSASRTCTADRWLGGMKSFRVRRRRGDRKLPRSAKREIGRAPRRRGGAQARGE